jgi:hypothetical protein
LAPIAQKTHNTCALMASHAASHSSRGPGHDLGHLIEAEAELPLDLFHGRQDAPLRMREAGARMRQLREGYDRAVGRGGCRPCGRA